jgi:hypothetical protein
VKAEDTPPAGDKDRKAGEWPPAPIGGARSNPPNVPGPRRTVHKPLGRRVKTSEHEDIG